MATIKIFDIQTAGKDYTIRVLKGGVKILNRVIDTAYVNITIMSHHYLFAEAKVVVTSEVEDSFSNLLTIYNVTINLIMD